MPRGDGRGPAGHGPRTGRGLGYCAGYDSPGFTKPGPGQGRGFRRNFGPGHRMRRGFNQGNVNNQGGYAPNDNPQNEYTKNDEINELKNYAKDMKRELNAVIDRIEQLEENN
jgi:hypothetical protein